MKAVEEDLNIVCEFLTHGLSPFIRQHDQTEISHDHQWMPFYEQHSLGEIAKITSISKTDLSRRQGEYVRTSDGWFPVIKVWRNDTLVLKYWLDKELLPVKMTQQSEQPLLLPQPGHIQAVPKLFPPVGGE